MSTDLVAVLAGIPALASLDRDSLNALSAAFESASYPDGSRILRQGESNDKLFLLHRGSIAIRVRRGGRRETVAELGAPNIFGELSFVNGRPCSADLEALGPVEAAALRREKLAALGPTGDALLRALLDVVAVRLHDTVSGAPTLGRARTVWLRADDAGGIRCDSTMCCNGRSESAGTRSATTGRPVMPTSC